MSEEDYDKRSNTVRQFKKQNEEYRVSEGVLICHSF